MKKPFEDIITEKIKEVMDLYEPDYSPQAWEKLRKQLPVPEFWLKRVFLKYKFWVSDIAMIGFLFIIYNAASVLPEEKDSAVDPQFSETIDHSGSEKPIEIAHSENSSFLRQNISEMGISRKEENISTKPAPVLLTDSLSTAGQVDLQTENAIAEMPEGIERKPVKPILLEGKEYHFQFNITELIPIKSHGEEIPVLKSPYIETAGRSKFQWPEFNSLFTKDDGYDKFIGPNEVAIFYSPEILRTRSLKTLGISNGIGISLEGPVRSSFSISTGLSYQALDFNVTVFSEKVPLSDISGGIVYIDSIGITSGSYKYLEIPVSFNFKFLESIKSQVWFATGISSVIFLKQDYSSTTRVGGNNDQVNVSAKGWENILPAASINLGLLYRYKFSDHLFLHSSFLYKPHLVPLGYNSMKLNRLNLQVGIIYSFGRKNHNVFQK
jgi:hypothetical protein